MRFVPYQRDDHAVQVEEEHDQVEAKLDERFLKRRQSESLLKTLFSPGP